LGATVVASLTTFLGIALESFSRKKRRVEVKAFKAYSQSRLTDADEMFFDAYIKNGYSDLLRLTFIFATDSPIVPEDRRSELLFKRLIAAEIIQTSESGLKVNADREQVFRDFTEFLRRKDALRSTSSKS
jgi:hypothetical protein